MSRPSANPDNSKSNSREAISVNPREPNLALCIVFLLVLALHAFDLDYAVSPRSIRATRNRVLLLERHIARCNRSLEIQTLEAAHSRHLAAHRHMRDVD